MFCSNCGNEITEGQKFCNKCGNKIVDEKSEEKKIKNENKDFTIGKRQKESFVKKIIIIFLTCGITYFLLFFLCLFVGTSVPTFLTIIIIGIGILLCLSSIGAEIILGKCPYCNSDISVPGESAATNCPICKKRIMIKDNKFYKV